MEPSPGDCLEAAQPSVGTLCLRSARAGLALQVTPESWRWGKYRFVLGNMYGCILKEVSSSSVM